MIHFLIFGLLTLGVAQADRLSLEGGLTTTGNFPTGTGTDPVFASVGFTALASYEFDRWSFGVVGHGTVSHVTAITIQAKDYNIRGNLSRRQYGIGPIARYFFKDNLCVKRWYLELGFIAAQTDFIHADKVFFLPQSPDYARLFLRGGGFSLGAGYRPRSGPWFYQVNYELDHYETLGVLAKENHVHRLIAEPALNSVYFNHTISVITGIDVFGR